MRISLLVLLILAFASGCASSDPRERGQRVDVTLLTRTQLEPFSTNSAYEAVEALRGNWLRTRGRTSLRVAGEVRVYLDGTPIGGVEALRAIRAADVGSMRYYDAVDAAARFGLDHGQGAIEVFTRY